MKLVVATESSTLMRWWRASLLPSPTVVPVSTVPWRWIAPVRARIASSSVVLPLWNGPTSAMHRGPEARVPFCAISASLAHPRRGLLGTVWAGQLSFQATGGIGKRRALMAHPLGGRLDRPLEQAPKCAASAQKERSDAMAVIPRCNCCHSCAASRRRSRPGGGRGHGAAAGAAAGRTQAGPAQRPRDRADRRLCLAARPEL